MAKPTAIIKRSIVINGHKTSVSLEDPFWDGLKQIADMRQMTLSKLVEEIDENRPSKNLSSSIRIFVYAWADAGKKIKAAA